MMEVRQTAAFRRWFDKLRDIRTKTQIVRRIERTQAGQLGDVSPVGQGVSEMRIHYGSGYRLYFVQRGSEIIILLCGGDKALQAGTLPLRRIWQGSFDYGTGNYPLGHRRFSR